MACSQEGWTFVEGDLKGIGGKDVSAHAKNSWGCGSGGCVHDVYMPIAGGYQRTDIQWAEEEKDDSLWGYWGEKALIPSKRQANGYLVLVGRYKAYSEYSIIESTPEGDVYSGWELVLVHLVWNGHAYEVRRMRDDSLAAVPNRKG